MLLESEEQELLTHPRLGMDRKEIRALLWGLGLMRHLARVLQRTRNGLAPRSIPRKESRPHSSVLYYYLSFNLQMFVYKITLSTLFIIRNSVHVFYFLIVGISIDSAAFLIFIKDTN